MTPERLQALKALATAQLDQRGYCPQEHCTPIKAAEVRELIASSEKLEALNVAQYAMLQTLVARLAGLTPGVLTHSIADAHVYENQVPSVERWREQARSAVHHAAWSDYVIENSLGLEAPKLEISEFSQSTIDDFTLAQVRILGYSHLGKVEIPVSV